MVRLSRRQTEMVQQLALGRCNKEIAVALGVEVGTVKTTLHNAYIKMGVTSRLEALVLAQRQGLVG